MSEEWYSGSDKSGVVKNTIATVVERKNAGIKDSNNIAQMNKLLAIEKEDNWRGYIVGFIGIIHNDNGDHENAEKSFSEAMTYFKPYLNTFKDVGNTYCQASYKYGHILYDKKEYHKAVCVLYQCLLYMHGVYDDDFISGIYLALGSGLNQLCKDEESKVFLEHAASVETENCIPHEKLMVVYYNLGEINKSSDIFDFIVSKWPDYDFMDRVIDFGKKNLGKTVQ